MLLTGLIQVFVRACIYVCACACECVCPFGEGGETERERERERDYNYTKEAIKPGFCMGIMSAPNGFPQLTS